MFSHSYIVIDLTTLSVQLGHEKKVGGKFNYFLCFIFSLTDLKQVFKNAHQYLCADSFTSGSQALQSHKQSYSVLGTFL